jgi:tellurite resistance protein TerB
MLNWLKDRTNETRAKLTAEVSKFRNKDFMEAVVAACAMVAAADGHIAPEEKRKMIGFLQRADEMKHFDTTQVVAFFEKIAGNYEFDGEIGKAEALKVIGRVRSKHEQARMVVRVACVIGASDGNFDEDEKAAVRTICADLGLSPSDFDL